jgi:ABC-type enterobactin transport system permease subunit
MRTIRDYGIARLIIIGFAIGVIFELSKAAFVSMFMKIFHISPHPLMIGFATGAVTSLAVVVMLTYFIKIDKDK